MDGPVEAVIFASPEPVVREALASLVGRDCNLDLLLDDIRAELIGWPYDLVAVAGGRQHRTKRGFADAIHTATCLCTDATPLSKSDSLVLMCIGFYQPITRAELGQFFVK